jgi:hypothetical protein
MLLMRVLRNFAVLSILAVAVLASTPRQAEARRCTRQGMQCPPQYPPCCPGLVCVPASTRAFCEPRGH